MEVKDIKLDDDFDLVIENGDFKVSSSDMQHIQLICITDLGHWKQFPIGFNNTDATLIVNDAADPTKGVLFGGGPYRDWETDRKSVV